MTNGTRFRHRARDLSMRVVGSRIASNSSTCCSPRAWSTAHYRRSRVVPVFPLRAARGRELPCTDQETWATVDGNRIAVVVWDWVQPEQKVSNKPFFTRLVPAKKTAMVDLRVKSLSAGRYRLTYYRTGFRANDAFSEYLDMGAPTSLTPQQIERLHGSHAISPRRIAESEPIRKANFL